MKKSRLQKQFYAPVFFKRRLFLSLFLILPALHYAAASSSWGLHNAPDRPFQVSSSDKEITVSGRVVNEKGEPLPGVTIQDEASKAGTVTNAQGEFSIRAKDDGALNISYIGYEDQRVPVNGRSYITITLKLAASGLNEVVVVGYTKTRNNDRTGAITTIAAKDFSQVHYTSITEKLQGQVPGLSVSGNSGVPGTSVLVRLRGATSINAGNDPLYVVDGVFVNSDNLQNISMGGQVPNFLSDINPDDIESVTVLKDANATAVYGARGANGVILITTKRGALDSRTRINVNVEYGLSKSTNLWQLATGPEQGELVNAAWINDGNDYSLRPFRPVDSAISGYPAYGNPEDQPTYDRLGMVFRTAVSQKYNVSVTGGSSKTNFYLGGNYENDQATMRLQDFKRYSFRLNLDHSVFKNFKVGTSNTISYVPRREVRVGDGPAGLFQAALHTPTFSPLYNEDGSYYKVGVFDNIVAILKNSDTYSYSLRSINNVYATWTIVPGLSFKSSLSNDYTNYHEKAYYNTNLVYGQPAGQAQDAITTKETLIAEQLLNYNHTFREKNDLSVFLGNTVQYTTLENESLTGTGFPSDQFKRIASAAVQTASSSGSNSRLVSFFTGLNYSLNHKYSIDANVRADASSRFGADRRWGYFPSIGLGWNITNEPFFPQTDYINDLRLKASYGLTGNQNISDFASRGLWNGGQNYLDKAGIAPSQLANPDLKWETTRQFDIGLSGTLIKQRLNFAFDYYNKYTYDLLLAQPVPLLSGFSSVYSNVGEMSNKGVELLLNSTNVRTKDFSWQTTFTISHNRNIVEKLLTPITASYDMYRIQQGYPLYSIYAYNELGVDPQTGNVIDEDVNKDGKITSDDQKIVGNIWPKFEGAFKNTFSFKGIDVNLNFVYKDGNKVYNYTRYFLETGGRRGVSRAVQKSALNYWKKPGDVGVLPRPSSLSNPDGSFNYVGFSSRFLEDASYIRLRDVTIGYNFPERLISRLRLSNARIYLTGSNLFVLTKYSGPDPEANNSGDSGSTVQGLDFNTTPQPKTVVLGLNLTL